MSDPLSSIGHLRVALLEVHEALLAVVRIEYEKEHGRVESSGELLQLVAFDSAFAWLHPLSKLVVEIEDVEAADDEARARELVEALLHPGTGFYTRYVEVMQTAPDVVLAHAQLSRRLHALPAPSAKRATQH